MNLKEKLIALIVLVVGVFVTIGFMFELNNTDNRVYLHSTIEVNNDSIESLNNKISLVNNTNAIAIHIYNDCVKAVGEDTDLFSCGEKPQIKIFKKLNKIDINNL